MYFWSICHLVNLENVLLDKDQMQLIGIRKHNKILGKSNSHFCLVNMQFSVSNGWLFILPWYCLMDS